MTDGEGSKESSCSIVVALYCSKAALHNAQTIPSHVAQQAKGYLVWLAE